MMDSPLRTHVRKILRAIAATNAAEAAVLKRIEDEGHRIVEGGGINGGVWHIADWRTGEMLASGDGGFEEYEAAGRRLDPEGRWIHIDHVHGDNPWDGYDISPTDGIPPTLSDALVDWVEHGNTPTEEVAQIAGWSEEETARYLETQS